MKQGRRPQRIRFLAAIFFAFLLPQSNGDSAGRIPVASTHYLEEAQDPSGRARAAFYRDFLVRNPDVELIPFRSIHLPPAILPAERSRLFFAMLGDAGPDHIVSNPEDCHLFSEQRFLYPLDQYLFDVLKDRSGRPVDPDGRPLDPTEHDPFFRDRTTGKYSVAVPIARRVSIYPEWEKLPARFRLASVRDDRVYSIPVLDSFTGIIYRRDLFVSAGLDPDSPPQDWDVFLYCAQKLTDPDKPIRGAPVQKGQTGFACEIDPGSEWLNYLWQAGGDAVRKIKFCPKGHRVEAKNEAGFPRQCPLCGESLLPVRASWAPAFDSDAGLLALRFYRTLRLLRWTRCPRCGEPVNISSESDRTRSLVCSGPKGCWHSFPLPSPASIYRGVVREIAPQETADRRIFMAKLFERGETAMMMVNHPYRFIASVSLPAENMGMMPLPSGWQWVKCPRCGGPIVLTSETKSSGRAVCPRDSTSIHLETAERHGGLSTNLLGVEMWGISSSSPRVTRDAVWRLIEHRMSDHGRIAMAQSLVDEDSARAIPPSDLRLAGYPNLYQTLPKSWILVEQESLSSGRFPPWLPNWTAFLKTDMPEVLGSDRPDDAVPLRLQLSEAAAQCAVAIGAEKPIAAQERRKGVSGILIPLAVLVILVMRWLYHATAGPKRRSLPTSSPAPRKRPLAWLLLSPALISLVLWVYLPLLRGTQMAFYDWRALGGRQFLGVLNFAAIFSSLAFWRIFLQTILFVALSVVLGFAAPVLLALLLAEVPRGKQWLRTIFYLPALTSGLAVALLWRLVYEPTETGFLNWLLLHMPHSTYLILPFLLMVAFTGLSALFFRRREFIPGAILLALSVGLIVLIPRIQPLRRPVNWLANPAAGGIGTMLCVVLPAVWASAGPGSLIYLAALRTIPVQLYESAELDGAGVFAKIRHVTLVELRPLLVINLVGALLGTSQAIRNLFVLTGGQPDGKTKVLALDIWYNAFIYLKLGYATALAWILTSMIIGFAVYQLRRLFRADCPRLPEGGVAFMK